MESEDGGSSELADKLAIWEGLFHLVLADLAWTSDDLQTDEENGGDEGRQFATCPYFPSHRVPIAKLEAHVRRCCLRKTGYHHRMGPEAMALLYEEAAGVVCVSDEEEDEEEEEAEVEEAEDADENDELGLDEDDESMDSGQPRSLVIRRLKELPDLIIDGEDETLIGGAEDLSFLLSHDLQQINAGIQSWGRVPVQFSRIDVRQVHKALSWIRDFVPLYSPIFRDEEDFQWVLGIILQEREPDRVVKALRQFMGTQTLPFVLALWKFLVYQVIESRKLRENPSLQPLQYVPPPRPTVPPPPPPADDKPDVPSEPEPTKGNVRRLRKYNECVSQAKEIISQRPDYKAPTLDLLLTHPRLPGQQRQRRQSDQASGSGDGSRLHLLAAERDYKRRRRKYRAKNVHLTKRTPTQVTRDYINKRMGELEGIIRELNPPPPSAEEKEPERVEELVRRSSSRRDSTDGRTKDSHRSHSQDRESRSRRDRDRESRSRGHRTRRSRSPLGAVADEAGDGLLRKEAPTESQSEDAATPRGPSADNLVHQAQPLPVSVGADISAETLLTDPSKQDEDQGRKERKHRDRDSRSEKRKHKERRSDKDRERKHRSKDKDRSKDKERHHKRSKHAHHRSKRDKSKDKDRERKQSRSRSKSRERIGRRDGRERSQE